MSQWGDRVQRNQTHFNLKSRIWTSRIGFLLVHEFEFDLNWPHATAYWVEMTWRGIQINSTHTCMPSCLESMKRPTQYCTQSFQYSFFQFESQFSFLLPQFNLDSNSGIELEFEKAFSVLVWRPHNPAKHGCCWLVFRPTICIFKTWIISMLE